MSCPVLLNGEALRKAGLSPASDYHRMKQSGNHVLFDNVKGYIVLALQDAGSHGGQPANTPIDMDHALKGATMLFDVGGELLETMFDCGLLFSASDGRLGVSVSTLPERLLRYRVRADWATSEWLELCFHEDMHLPSLCHMAEVPAPALGLRFTHSWSGRSSARTLSGTSCCTPVRLTRNDGEWPQRWTWFCEMSLA